jgi:hypothetical protein
MFVTILRDHEGGFLTKLATLNKRADRLGMLPLTIASVTRTTERDEDGYQQRYTHYVIEGAMPRLNGWTLVAKIEHTEDGNLLHAYGGYDALPWADARPVCEHCGHNRHRHTTYVVSHEDGTIKQVGSTCVGDFTRSDLLFYAARADELGGFADGLCRLDRTTSAHAVLAFALAVIEHHGFAKSADPYPTWQRMEDIQSDIRDHKIASPVTPAHIARAAEILTWAREGGSNEYRHNLAVATRPDLVEKRLIPLIVSAVPSYQRHLANQIKKSETAPSAYVGTVGEKLVETVTINRVSSFDTFYGRMDLISMLRGDDVLIWKTTSAPAWVEQGATVTIRGTVKEHSTFRDTKQTVLTRVKAV